VDFLREDSKAARDRAGFCEEDSLHSVLAPNFWFLSFYPCFSLSRVLSSSRRSPSSITLDSPRASSSSARGFSFRHNGGESGYWKRIVDHTAGACRNGHLRPYISVCRIHKKRDEVVVPKVVGVHFGTCRFEGKHVREPRGAHPSLTLAHPTREMRGVKVAWNEWGRFEMSLELPRRSIRNSRYGTLIHAASIDEAGGCSHDAVTHKLVAHIA
jgi:hypothetical protein